MVDFDNIYTSRPIESKQVIFMYLRKYIHTHKYSKTTNHKKSLILKETGGNVVVFLREEKEGKNHGIII